MTRDMESQSTAFLGPPAACSASPDTLESATSRAESPAKRTVIR